MSNAKGTIQSHYNSSATDDPTDIVTRQAEITYIQITNPNVTDLYLWLWDVPAEIVVPDGSLATPVWAVFFIPAGTEGFAGVHIEDFQHPLESEDGFCYAISDDPDSVSAAGSPCGVQVFYR